LRIQWDKSATLPLFTEYNPLTTGETHPLTPRTGHVSSAERGGEEGSVLEASFHPVLAPVSPPPLSHMSWNITQAGRLSGDAIIFSGPGTCGLGQQRLESVISTDSAKTSGIAEILCPGTCGLGAQRMG